MKPFRIEDICQRITSGGTPSRKRNDFYEAKPNGHLWVKSKELLDASISHTEEHISDLGLKGSAAKYLEAGTVLVAMYGANVGQLGWLRKPATVNQAICGLTTDPEQADPRWLFYALMHHRHRIIAMAQGAAQQNISAQLIKSFELPVPPLATQQRIAAILSAYDDLIETNTRRIAILEEMARRLYEEWFVHFRFPGHEAVEFDGDLPRGWSEVPLGAVANITWGDTKTTKKSYVDDGYVAYSAAGPDGFLPHFDYDRTGIVLSAIGAKCGLTWFARGKWSCIKNTIRLFSSDEAVSDEYLFFTTGFSDYWPKRGAAQPFISQGDARQCKVVVPPETLHERFLAVARPALKQADHLRSTNANLRAQRDLLLPKLVSGEIDLNGAVAALEAAE